MIERIPPHEVELKEVKDYRVDSNTLKFTWRGLDFIAVRRVGDGFRVVVDLSINGQNVYYNYSPSDNFKNAWVAISSELFKQFDKKYTREQSKIMKEAEDLFKKHGLPAKDK